MCMYMYASEINTYLSTVFTDLWTFLGGCKGNLLLAHQPTGNMLWECMCSMWLGTDFLWLSRWIQRSGLTTLVTVAAQIWLGFSGFTASSFMPTSKRFSLWGWKKPTKEVKYSVVKLRRERKSHTYTIIRMWKQFQNSTKTSCCRY